MGYLAGTIEVINCTLSVYYLLNIFLVREAIVEKELSKDKLLFASILAFIFTTGLSIFGCIYNCTFINTGSRILGVKLYLSFIVIVLLINIFISKKDLYKRKKKINCEYYILINSVIIDFLAIATFAIALFSIKLT